MNIPTQLKALMAAGALASMVALWAVFLFIAPVVSTGGVDDTHSKLIIVSTAVPAFFMGWAALAFLRILMAEVKREKAGA